MDNVLKTSKCLIRPVIKEDAYAIYHGWGTCEDVIRYLIFDRLESMEQSKMLVEKIIANNQSRVTCFSICTFENEAIGMFNFFNISEDQGEMGFWIDKKYWYQGLMPEVLKVMIDYGFNQLNLKRLIAMHHPENIQSGRVMMKAGMHYFGMTDYISGKYHWTNLPVYEIKKD